MNPTKVILVNGVEYKRRRYLGTWYPLANNFKSDQFEGFRTMDALLEKHPPETVEVIVLGGYRYELRRGA